MPTSPAYTLLDRSRSAFGSIGGFPSSTPHPPMEARNGSAIKSSARRSKESSPGGLTADARTNGHVVQETDIFDEEPVQQAHRLSGDERADVHAFSTNSRALNSFLPANEESFYSSQEAPLSSRSSNLSSSDIYFDAADGLDEYSSDEESIQSGRSLGRNSGLHHLRDIASRLHEEAGKRAAAELALEQLRQQHEEMWAVLSREQAKLPPSIMHALKIGSASNGSQTSSRGLEQEMGNGGAANGTFVGSPDQEGFSNEEQRVEEKQEVIVARMVADAIARGVASAHRAYNEQEALLSKEREISRLRDKLQYWERMNHEMSQQNQESLEMARESRRRRHRLQKILLASLGISLGVTVSALAAYLFYPWDDMGKGSLTGEAGDSSDRTAAQLESG